MACYVSSTIYNCDAKTIFQAAVHILRGDLRKARKVYSGDLNEYDGIDDLLGCPYPDQNFVVLEWFEGRNDFIPRTPDLFFERVFVQQKFTDPEVLSSCGFLEQSGIKCHNGFLNDAPSEIYEKRLEKTNKYLLDIVNISDQLWPDMNTNQRTSLEILRWTILNGNQNYRDLVYPIDQFNGYHGRYMLLMTNIAVIEELEDVKKYIARIIQGGHKFNRIVTNIRQKMKQGCVAPRCCLEKVADTLRKNLADLRSDDNKLLKTVKEKYSEASGDNVLPHNFIVAISQAINQFLLPSLENCLCQVEDCIKHSADELGLGLWKMRRGVEYYIHCLRWQSTIDISPEEVHEIGQKETRRILQMVSDIVTGLNNSGDMTLDGSLPPSEILRQMATSPIFKFNNGAETLNECQCILADITQEVAPLFNVKPRMQCEVTKLPDALTHCGAAAFYQEGSLDRTRPGQFYINTQHVDLFNRAQMKSLTVHEAIPGHHFQISRMIENKTLPYFRRCYSSIYAGFVEGWGLYCEHLADMIGFYKNADGIDSYDTIGYLTYELLRSARLVVDTGIHCYKWTREEAIRFLMDNTGMSRNTGQAEVDRYAVLPGQACSYMLGKLKLLEIRDKLSKRPGFNLADFHDKVLSLGSLPLGNLEEIMLNE